MLVWALTTPITTLAGVQQATKVYIYSHPAFLPTPIPSLHTTLHNHIYNRHTNETMCTFASTAGTIVNHKGEKTRLRGTVGVIVGKPPTAGCWCGDDCSCCVCVLRHSLLECMY